MKNDRTVEPIEMDKMKESSQAENLITNITNIFDEMIHTFLDEASRITTFDKYNAQHVYLMCLYGRIIELGVTALNLIKIKDHAGIPIILRSQLEAFVDFANLIDNKDFIYTIGANFVAQKRKHIENIRKHFGDHEVNLEFDDAENAFAGYKKQNIVNKFENIKLNKTHAAMYSQLCSYSHNNLAILELRHIEKNEEGIKVVFFKDEPLQNLLRFVFTLGALLVDTHTNLIAFFDKSMESKSADVCSKYSELQKAVNDVLASVE